MNEINKKDFIDALTDIVELEKQFDCSLNPLTDAVVLSPVAPGILELENGVHAYWEVYMPDESTEEFSMDYFLGNDYLSVAAWNIKIGESICRFVEENVTPERAADLAEQWFTNIFYEELKSIEKNN